MTTASLAYPLASSSSSSTRVELEVMGDVFVSSNDIARNLIIDYGSGKIALTAASIHFRIPSAALNSPFHHCVASVLPTIVLLSLSPKKKPLPPLSPTVVAKRSPQPP
uniref:Uncharacterized protein n=1 Tax=Oryza barthii TaxID=65489 RepID=A0A0D3G955_9ORYZ